jgi:hypothetical protein
VALRRIATTMRGHTSYGKPKSAPAILAVLAACCLLNISALSPRQTPSPQTSQPPTDRGDVTHSDNSIPRGQKLVLKDGTFQLVREYNMDGDRVRYYSLDTHEWEEMPASLVDWDATKKAAAVEASKDAALVSAVDKREKAENVEVLNVDSSIEPAPGIFLPQDTGLFVFDGKTIQVVKQAEMKSTLSKGKMIEKVLVPIPIVPTRHMISIVGIHAKLRTTNGQPEFYMRTPDGSEPEIDLVRAKIHGGERQVENVDELMGETAENRKAIALQRWQIATDVYRYTVAKPLEPGEYVLAQSVPNDQYSIYLWDFGIDPAK